MINNNKTNGAAQGVALCECCEAEWSNDNNCTFPAVTCFGCIDTYDQDIINISKALDVSIRTVEILMYHLGYYQRYYLNKRDYNKALKEVTWSLSKDFEKKEAARKEIKKMLSPWNPEVEEQVEKNFPREWYLDDDLPF